VVKVEFRRALALRSEIRRTPPTSATSTAWERTLWLATQRAAWEV